ncbi:MAG: N-acetylglucosamine-6-phosphate deacetylase [Leptolyngbya sp. IPPAS B-1204]|nr:MAG: N-acetylglucosamine-6-phosphate deacetylase [Leptolyngbya sp. IPPAS B-1204]
MYALTNCHLYTSEQALTDQAVLIDAERIVDIVPASTLDSLHTTIHPIIDLTGYSVAPGFIDLQLNGCGGVMFNDAITAETLEIMHQTNLKSGTTSYLPTLITAPDADMLKAIEVVQSYRQHSPYNVLGLHLEGPYLNPKRKGIHNEAYIRPPDRALLETIAAAGPDVVKLITLAPEQATPAEIRLLAEQGIVVSAGHTDATYEQAIAGFEAGVAMVTHLFNAMSPWLGRSPGVVGAVFSHPEVYAGIIADGYHVHFESIALAHRLKRSKLLLVTDATPPVGTQMASFWIGGQEVFYKDGTCVSADGTLGGSALTMIEAVANCVQQVELPLAEALRMASLYPAQAIGVDDHLGRIAPGYVANLTIFDDTSQIKAMVDRGEYIPVDIQ